MNKLQEIRDALQKYAADEAECHVRGMTHIPKTASEALSTLDALMETHVLVLKEPTSGMLDDGYAMDCVPVGKLERAYKAMIAAAQEKK